ncbi:hypothetical protein Hamer_G026454, partial [Homarus americanus]
MLLRQGGVVTLLLVFGVGWPGVVLMNSQGISGRLTAQEFIEMLQDGMLPSVTDKSPIHTARIVSYWFAAHPNIIILLWVPKSPDLNLIESLGSSVYLMQERLIYLLFLIAMQTKQQVNMQCLLQELEDIFADVPQPNPIVTHDVELIEGASPVKQAPYRVFPVNSTWKSKEKIVLHEVLEALKLSSDESNTSDEAQGKFESEKIQLQQEVVKKKEISKRMRETSWQEDSESGEVREETRQKKLGQKTCVGGNNNGNNRKEIVENGSRTEQSMEFEGSRQEHTQ